MKTIKVVFFGTPKFSILPLRAIVSEGNYNIQAVITNPDKPRGRGGRKGKPRRTRPPALKVEALEHNLTVLQPHSLRTDREFLEKIKSLKPDLFILSAYAKIIPKEYINIPPLGTINIHPSLLPQYRGPTPIQFAILNDDKKTGVTLILLDEKFDHGPIVAQEEYELTGEETFVELHDALSALSARMLTENLPKYIEDKIKPAEQDHDKATFTKIFGRKDGELIWTEPAEDLDRKVRALNPEPGTHTYYKLKTPKMLKIHTVEPNERDFKKPPGTVIMDNKEIFVQTGKGSLKLLEIQLAGRKKLTAQEFARGHEDFIGSVLTQYKR